MLSSSVTIYNKINKWAYCFFSAACSSSWVIDRVRTGLNSTLKNRREKYCCLSNIFQNRSNMKWFTSYQKTIFAFCLRNRYICLRVLGFGNFRFVKIFPIFPNSSLGINLQQVFCDYELRFNIKTGLRAHSRYNTHADGYRWLIGVLPWVLGGQWVQTTRKNLV